LDERQDSDKKKSWSNGVSRLTGVIPVAKQLDMFPVLWLNEGGRIDDFRLLGIGQRRRKILANFY
jgi:hypothetical protein